MMKHINFASGLRSCAAVAVALTVTAVIAAEDHSTSFSVLEASSDILREEKRTPLGLYLTAMEAAAKMKANPDILFIDVRDPVEISLTGHPVGLDAIVPVRVLSDQFDTSLNEFILVDNPSFVDEMDDVLRRFGGSKDREIIITCGSGWRSAVAVRKLARAGYTNAWHVTDGYEGEEKPGLNSDNAWRLAGLPWSARGPSGGMPWQR